jgi:gliding motility-associated-like protein
MTKNGCEVSLLDSFEAYVSPSADFLVSNVCDGENILPIDNSTISAPATINGYQWYLNGASSSTDKNPIISTSGAGDYDIKLKVSSVNGCIDSIQKSATVYPTPSTAFSSSKQCFGENTTFTNTSAVSSGSLPSILWTIDRVDYTSNTVLYVFPASGDYPIRLISESDKGCRDTLISTVPIHPLPVLDVQLAVDSGCIPLDAEVINNSTISTGAISSTTYTWGDGTENQSNTNIYDLPGTYLVSVVVESDQGCTSSVDISKPVRVFDLPTADFRFTPLEPSTLTEFVTFKDSSSTDVVQRDWTTSDGGYYSGISAEHQFLDSGEYNVTLTVVNDKGCVDDISKLIYVNADLFVHIPNGFSPNGDGVNDTYGLGGLTQGVFQFQLTIYNRWGELVYTASDVNDRWDGTYKGKPVPQGVYVYVVQYTNPKQTKWFYLNGEIHVLK